MLIATEEGIPIPFNIFSAFSLTSGSTLAMTFAVLAAIRSTSLLLDTWNIAFCISFRNLSECIFLDFLIDKMRSSIVITTGFRIYHQRIDTPVTAVQIVFNCFYCSLKLNDDKSSVWTNKMNGFSWSACSSELKAVHFGMPSTRSTSIITNEQQERSQAKTKALVPNCTSPHQGVINAQKSAELYSEKHADHHALLTK